MGLCFLTPFQRPRDPPSLHPMHSAHDIPGDRDEGTADCWMPTVGDQNLRNG